RLVAAVFGLKPEVKRFTWENLFVGIDSGKVDVGFSNITDTEERKRKYEFASYRKDDLAFEAPKDSKFRFDGDYRTLAGTTVSVGAGTNQERILLEWKNRLEKEGKKLTVKYFQETNSTYLALSSGKIDAYFGPSPNLSYHVTQTSGTPQATRIAGQFSGAGATLQGLIAATAKKDSGLAEPLAEAINHLIDNGQYAKWLAAWNLSGEAVEKAEVNPPGLPLDNS
ncbi:transporter substrate-binding domain-containing protein, partial [Streptomyces nigra]